MKSRWQFRLVGSVVMPEHVPLLIGEPQKGDPSRVLQVLKQKTSRALPGQRRKSNSAQLVLRFGESPPESPRFWQRRFYDFNVWSAKKVREKPKSMHFNPMKRKLVSHPKDWPWSSFSFCANRRPGLLPIDPVE